MPTTQEQKSEFQPRSGSALVLAGWLVLCTAVAFHSMACIRHGLPVWYAGLIKPPLNPSAFVLGIAWGLTAPLTAVAVWMTWKTRPSPCRYRGLRLFSAQLLLNFLWAWIFFIHHQLVTSLVDIVALLVALLLVIFTFRKMSMTAAWLMVPSLAWTAYLMYLNLALWRLNP